MGWEGLCRRMRDYFLEDRPSAPQSSNSKEPCQDEGGAEREKVPGRENCQSPQGGGEQAQLAQGTARKRPRSGQRNGWLQIPNRSYT